MFERLGRYLRAAGYDTGIVGEREADDSVVAAVAREGRVLLTADRALAARAGRIGKAVLLPNGGLDAAAEALTARLGIDWLRAPFSRCLVDNTPVVRASEEDRRRLPPRSRQVGGAVMVCPDCGRLYWPGSHVRRMTARLERWNAGGSGPA